MSTASKPADARNEPRIDRLQPWIAALTSLVLHLLALLLALSTPPITITTPQGTAAGSRMVVDYIDLSRDKAEPIPPVRPSASAPAATTRVQTTRVTEAADPIPPEETLPSDALTVVPVPRQQTQAPPVDARPTPRQRRYVRGQPPGMLPEDLAPVHAGMARSSSIQPGRRNDSASSEHSLEVGGYQVYYNQRSQARLRAWHEQGITEIFLPLPGTRQYMICPLEIALRHGSGDCRLLDPNSPEMDAIGDAREVINMQQVYRRGELVWRGPGPYR